MNEIRISLTAEDFEKLVNGEIVEKSRHAFVMMHVPHPGEEYNVKILLQDIGWHKMIDIIAEAMQKGYNG